MVNAWQFKSPLERRIAKQGAGASLAERRSNFLRLLGSHAAKGALSSLFVLLGACASELCTCCYKAARSMLFVSCGHALQTRGGSSRFGAHCCRSAVK